MSASSTALDRGRASFDRRAWREAFHALSRADGDEPLDRDDLERLAWAAALRGQDEAFLGALERLHDACLEAHDRKRAARAAFWLGFHLSSLGSASASGWTGRAARLIEQEPEPCAERGYLLLPEVHRLLAAAEHPAAMALARRAADIGERCGDRDLVALARSLEGRAVVRQGRLEAGFAVLDELMLGVTAGQLSPVVTGIVFCNVIRCCQQCYALDRAREWTRLMSRWCAEQPELVTFTGHCLVHRAEILRLGGSWREAIDEVRPICERSTAADPDVVGDAHYEHAELLRLRGELEQAEREYRLASEHGREPQPGLALLRSTQGRHDAAVGSIRRLLSTTTAEWQRARLLPAAFEILLAAGELDEAGAACAELESIALDYGGPVLDAMARAARGALLVGHGDARGAVEPLRRAFAVWHHLGAPYLAARARVLLARAFVDLGDREGAELEDEAARKVFERLGAATDLAALGATPAASAAGHGLSRRELEVLRLLASGKTNKAIARELALSERTVDRHVSNIFAKLEVASRTAATAFAFEHHLV